MTRRTRRRAVYTCLFGHSEPFPDHHYPSDAATDFILFTDDPALRSAFWDIRLIAPVAMDPVRAAKRIKHNHAEFLPGYAASLYIDNTVRLRAPLDAIFAHRAPGALVLFRHPWRDCLYAEAEFLLRAGVDTDRIREQIAFYRHLGHPEGAGLHATTVLLRDHGAAALASAMREWDLQTHRFSFRDQLSLPVIAARMNLPIAHFPGALTDNPLIDWQAAALPFRMPRQFDDLRYLALNPDVAAAGMDPRTHYAQFGRFEGRAY